MQRNQLTINLVNPLESLAREYEYSIVLKYSWLFYVMDAQQTMRKKWL